MDITVRALEERDLDPVVALQRACFPDPFPEELLWRAEHLREHLRIFPSGQFVALSEGKVVGSASSLRISLEAFDAHWDWDQTVGGPFLRAHDDSGAVLHGVDISVHQEFRGLGVGRRLYEARFDLCRRLGLRCFGTACRIPDYCSFLARTGLQHCGATVETYTQKVESGQERDRTLSPLLAFGLRLVGVSLNYMEDEESRNAAAILEKRL